MVKKIVSMLLSLALLLSSAAGLALAEENTQTLPKVGEVVHGFMTLDVQPLGIRDITMVYMEHEKTGAKLVYGACDDNERAFSVAFRTPAINDKGMPHVFEHSCLSGSEKYPDPSLFFSMINQTYVTFLNAMTYETVTCYPVASLSEEQLALNVDYNLNGVFKPLVLTDERAMMREAYRYELADRDSDITLNGTVYSEMKAAFSLSNAAYYNTRKLLYPGSYMANVSGGDPDYIPQMTQQELIDFHSSYYHPSNAMFTLHGKLDLERFLKQIDEFISRYDRREIDLEDTDYKPITGYHEQTVKFAVSKDSSAMPVASYAITLPGITIEEYQRLSLVCALLVTEGNPIGDLCKERMPGATISVSIDTDTPAAMLSFTAQNLTEEQIPVFKTVIEDGIAAALKDGIDRAKLDALCATLDYSNFNTTLSNAFGQSFVQNVPVVWGQNGGDPYAFSSMMQSMLALRGDVEAGLVDEAFVKYLTEPETAVLCATVPDVGALEAKNAALAQSLKDMKAAMTDEELDALIARTADFAAWTEANAKNTMIDRMKAVSAQELPEEFKRYTAEETMVDGMRVISSELDIMDRYVDVELIFDASCVPADCLYSYSLATMLLINMPTKNYSIDELEHEIMKSMYMPMIMATTITFADNKSYIPVVKVNWRTTRTDLKKSFELIEDVLFNTDWSQTADLLRLVDTNLKNERMIVNMMPEMMDMLLTDAYTSDSGKYMWAEGGPGNSEYCKSLLTMSEDELASEVSKLQETLKYVLNKNGFTLTCVGTKEAIAETTEIGAELFGRLDETKHDKADYSAMLPAFDKPVALTVDGNMQYNYKVINLQDNGIEDNAKLQALASIVSSKLMMPGLRFVGGAYGASSSYSYPIITVNTYRDPNLVATFEYYNKLGDEIRALELTQDDVDGFITTLFSQLATAFTPSSGADRAISDVITGKDTFKYYLDMMHELKQLTPEDVKELASVYDLLAEKGKMFTIGGTEAIEENRDMFDEIITYYME